MVAIQSDVPDARGGHEIQDSLDHAESRAQDRHERQLLSADALPGMRSSGVSTSTGSSARSLVASYAMSIAISSTSSLKIFVGVLLVAQNGKLMLDERMPDDGQSGQGRGGGHGADTTIFAIMKEYQAVILKLTQRTREDEDALTDLLNERSRGGWEPAMMSQDEQRLTVGILEARRGRAIGAAFPTAPP